jgi:hypothetical protein
MGLTRRKPFVDDGTPVPVNGEEFLSGYSVDPSSASAPASLTVAFQPGATTEAQATSIILELFWGATGTENVHRIALANSDPGGVDAWVDVGSATNEDDLAIMLASYIMGASLAGLSASSDGASVSISYSATGANQSLNATVDVDNGLTLINGGGEGSDEVFGEGNVENVEIIAARPGKAITLQSLTQTTNENGWTPTWRVFWSPSNTTVIDGAVPLDPSIGPDDIFGGITGPTTSEEGESLWVEMTDAAPLSPQQILTIVANGTAAPLP